MGLEHFYHIYAAGDWLRASETHFRASERHGLLDAAPVKIGLVGNSEQRADAIERLSWLDFEVVAEADWGWEQVTLDALWERARLGTAYFYAHTKGAGYPSALADAWRHSMTYDNVVNWRDRLDDLRQYETSGAYWLKSDCVEHREHQFFYAGNYWFARGSYLRVLDRPKTETRYQAEGWIGLRNPRARDCRPGLAYWGNFYEGPLDGASPTT